MMFIVFCTKNCSKKFCNIYRRTSMLDSLFNKVAGLHACNFIKRTLQHRYFLVNTAKFLRTPILKNILMKHDFSMKSRNP